MTVVAPMKLALQLRLEGAVWRERHSRQVADSHTYYRKINGYWEVCIAQRVRAVEMYWVTDWRPYPADPTRLLKNIAPVVTSATLQWMFAVQEANQFLLTTEATVQRALT